MKELAEKNKQMKRKYERIVEKHVVEMDIKKKKECELLEVQREIKCLKKSEKISEKKYL